MPASVTIVWTRSRVPALTNERVPILVLSARRIDLARSAA